MASEPQRNVPEHLETSSLVSSTTLPTSDAPGRWVGSRVGAYELLEEIGGGGMGRVFLAVRADDVYRKRVAIKLARATLDSTEFIERFRQERQILANLQHPNIVRLLDGGTTEDGLPYLVMDYIEGDRIDRYCDARELSITARLNLFRTLCSAVQYAHQNLIVHRDIKPNNILVTKDGVLQLFDFGVAKLLAPALDDTAVAHTRTGFRLMTLDYASPEQLRGERITTATDVYSLGIVLYELLTGYRPYTVSNRPDHEIMRIVCEQDPPSPSAMIMQYQRLSSDGGTAITDFTAAANAPSRIHPDPRSLMGDLDTIVLKAIRKEPERRYGSVEQFSEDLHRYLDGLPIRARKDTLGYRASKFVKRHVGAVAASTVIAMTLVGGIIATARQARIAENQRREAEAQRLKASKRFNDVRRLANSFLFEVHDAIAGLPGATPARKLVVSKALEYLDNLAAEAEGDTALQQELAAAYDRVADVQGAPFAANLGDAQGAVQSYQKAYEIRRALEQKNPGSPAFRKDLAYSIRKLGDGAFAQGKVADAVSRYRDASTMTREVLAKDPSNRELRRDLAETTNRLCNTLLPYGDTVGTIAVCRNYRELAEPLLQSNPDNFELRLAMATNTQLLGNALRLSGAFVEAKETFRSAEEQTEGLLTRNPSNAPARRLLARNHLRMASTLASLGEIGAAIDQYDLAVQGLKALADADPNDARVRLDLMFGLGQSTSLLLKAGRRSEAVESAKAGLALARGAAERPGAGPGDFNEYAHWLTHSEVSELRNPAMALQYAKRAVQGSEHPNAVYLDTLGWAYYRSGNVPKAVEVLEEALHELPPSSQAGPAKGLRAEIERDLVEFKERAH